MSVIKEMCFAFSSFFFSFFFSSSYLIFIDGRQEIPTYFPTTWRIISRVEAMNKSSETLVFDN